MYWSDKKEKWIINPGFVFTPEFCYDVSHYLAIGFLQLIDKFNEVYIFDDNMTLSDVLNSDVVLRSKPWTYAKLRNCALGTSQLWGFEYEDEFIENNIPCGHSDNVRFHELWNCFVLLNDAGAGVPDGYFPCSTVGELRKYVDGDEDLKERSLEYWEQRIGDISFADMMFPSANATRADLVASSDLEPA